MRGKEWGLDGHEVASCCLQCIACFLVPPPHTHRMLPDSSPTHASPRSIVLTVSGGMGSGKSSLVAVLTHGSDGRPVLDNGRGSARMSVLRHKHELESGRTSSISQQALGYDEQGKVLNYQGVSGKRL